MVKHGKDDSTIWTQLARPGQKLKKYLKERKYILMLTDYRSSNKPKSQDPLSLVTTNHPPAAEILNTAPQESRVSYNTGTM